MALLGTGLVVATQPAEANGGYGSTPVYAAPVYVVPGPACSSFWVHGYWHGSTWVPGHWKQICRHPSVTHFVPRYPLGGPECDPRIVGGLVSPTHPSVRKVVPPFPLGGPECDPRIVEGLASPKP